MLSSISQVSVLLKELNKRQFPDTALQLVVNLQRNVTTACSTIGITWIICC